jgi:hypothetical protein
MGDLRAYERYPLSAVRMVPLKGEDESMCLSVPVSVGDGGDPWADTD